MMKRLTSAFLAIFGAVLVLFLFTGEAEAIDLEPVNFTFSPDYPLQGEGL